MVHDCSFMVHVGQWWFMKILSWFMLVTKKVSSMLRVACTDCLQWFISCANIMTSARGSWAGSTRRRGGSLRLLFIKNFAPKVRHWTLPARPSCQIWIARTFWNTSKISDAWLMISETCEKSCRAILYTYVCEILELVEIPTNVRLVCPELHTAKGGPGSVRTQHLTELV